MKKSLLVYGLVLIGAVNSDSLLAFSGAPVTQAPVVTDKPKNKGFFEDRERGWYWHEVEPEPEEQKKQDEKVQNQAAPAVPQLSPRQQLKLQGEQWEDALASAILNPTNENYQAYLAMTAKIQQQSQAFASGLKNTTVENPQFDYTLENPVNPQAIMAKNEQREIQNVEVLKAVSQDSGFIFFFRSDCPYCHKFAPILKKFSETFGFTVIPVSLDGGGIPDFPYPKQNYDMGRKLNVSVVPALFLVQPDTNKVATVGYGYSDWSALVTRVMVAAGKLLEQERAI